MNNPLLTLFRRSGDAHLGQTLTRLARLATAAHRYETAMQFPNHESAPHQERHPNEHVDTSLSVHPPRTDAGVIHTEVGR